MNILFVKIAYDIYKNNIYDIMSLIPREISYNSQILKSDIPGRVTHLQNEEFKILQGDIKKMELET